MATEAPKRKDYFADSSGIAAFAETFEAHLGKLLSEKTAELIPPKNSQRLRHGDDWQHPGLPNAVGSGMQQKSAEFVIKFQDLVDHDLGAIERQIGQLVSDMHRQFQTMMYQTISTACDQSGNIVDAKAAGGLLEALAEMLEKIEFSADKNGNVSGPQLHVGPETFEKLKAAEKNAPPEILQRMRDARSRNIENAIEREAKRKARFARYGEDP